MKLSFPMFVGALFGQVYMLVEKAIASGLDAGSIASLNYANKLMQLPVGIFVTAMATAIYPTLSEMAAKKDQKAFSGAVASGIRLLSLIMLPAAVGLIVLREPIVTLAFERGSFDRAATLKTASALAFYSLGILGTANAQVLQRAFYSLNDSWTPVKVGIGVTFLNTALAFLLVHPLGHSGLALANSSGMLANFVVLLWLLRNKLSTPLPLWPALTKIAISAGIMGVIVALLYARLSPLGMVLALGASVLVGVVVYFALIIVLGVDEFTKLTDMVKRKLVRA